MTTSRREALRLLALALGATPFSMCLPTRGRRNPFARPGARRLFFDESDLDRIRRNAETPFLKSTFESWRDLPSSEAEALITKVLQTGDLLYDWGAGLEAIYRQAVLALLTGDDKHRRLTLTGLRTLRRLPEWDYMREADTRVIGLMRASKAVTATLFSLEALEQSVPDELRDALLGDVAEKGCVPCHLTIHQMNNPEEVAGWGVDDVQRSRITWDMSRWPSILAVNNLRAIPTMGLGLGALALEGRDERASTWHEAAVDSARRFLNLFEADGSYEEGISYVDFALRTLLLFLEADYRVRGDVDWVREANFDGIVDYIVVLQNGSEKDGSPDIVNISDSRNTVFTTVPSWISNRAGDPLAAYAAHHFSRPGYFADFLWFRPDPAGEPPGNDLKDVRLDLDWIVTRTGWDDGDTVVAFRSGRPSNHEHADRNTIMVKVRGERLLTDHFGAAYNPSDPRWMLRLPVAHNAVLVNGAGHQYHRGEEGTNAGKASAGIVQYEDLDDVVYWSSDATKAYRLVDDRIELVRRSVIFKKPDVIVLIDEIASSEPATAQILFHPDDRDGAAELEIFTGGEFAIQRPKARLRGRCYSDAPFRLERKRLDLPPDQGLFPYLEAGTDASRSIAILTALEIGAENVVEVATADSGWRLRYKREDFADVRLTADAPPRIHISA